MQVKLLHSGRSFEVKEVGSFNPKPYVREKLEVGETGYLTANIKSPKDVKMGDTITDSRSALAGAAGFSGNSSDGVQRNLSHQHRRLRASQGQHGQTPAQRFGLRLSTETSVALGFGFRCGFLGLLHLEIVQERLRREYGMDIIATYPSVVYRVTLNDGTVKDIDNPAFLPEPNFIHSIEEPVVQSFLICPNEYIGDMMALISEKRGVVDHTETLDSRRVMLTSVLPLNEILIDFHDRIKSLTRGFGSMDYEHQGYVVSDMVKLDMLVNTESVDAFSASSIGTKPRAGAGPGRQAEGSHPQQQYAVAFRRAIGGK
jgi:GTP-binding protein LepA